MNYQALSDHDEWRSSPNALRQYALDLESGIFNLQTTIQCIKKHTDLNDEDQEDLARHTTRLGELTKLYESASAQMYLDNLVQAQQERAVLDQNLQAIVLEQWRRQGLKLKDG